MSGTKRKVFGAEFKAKVGLEAIHGVKTINQIAQEHGVHHLHAAAEWRQQWWFANAATFRSNDFNISAGRYRPMNQTAVEHRNPRVLLDELAAIEVEIAEEVEALRLALSERDA